MPRSTIGHNPAASRSSLTLVHSPTGSPPTNTPHRESGDRRLSPRQGSTSSANDTSLHPEIRSIVSLTTAHTEKTYFSGSLIRKVERNPDGRTPHRDEDWRNVWAQLNGTTLSIWEVKIANRQGKEAPPLRIDVADAVRSTFRISPTQLKKLPSSVYPSPRFCHRPRNNNFSPSQIHQRYHSQH